jgi:branched-chain amino acid transport system permease protein
MLQIAVNGLMLGSTYTLIALGITLIFGLMNVMNFAHGQLYVLGGFGVYALYGELHWPFALALVVAAGAVALVGVVFERFLFRPVLRRAQREETTMLLAVGTALLLDSLALVIFGEKQRGVPEVVSGVAQWGDVYVPLRRLLTFGVALLLAGGFMAFMTWTKPGRALRAMAQDRETAALQGVNLKFYGALGFGIGAGLAGLAGGLLVASDAVNAGAGNLISIKAFIMIMIGGAGVVPGAIVGAFVLAFGEAIGYALIPGSLPYLLILLGLIVFLLFRPTGILGRRWG